MHDTAAPGTAAGLAARIEAATPPHRDRTVDALRAVAILGVVLGHWLVTALVADGAGPAWLLDRSLWLPAFALVLAGCLLVFGRLERPGKVRGGSRRAARRRSSC